MCLVVPDNIKNDKPNKEPEEKENINRHPMGSNLSQNKKINANIRYFEPTLEFDDKQSSGLKLYNYNVRVKDVVKHYQLVKAPTTEDGTSLYYVQNVEIEDSQPQIKELAEISEENIQNEEDTSSFELSEEELESRNALFFNPTPNKDNKPPWHEENENYQTYSLNSDNLLSAQIANRYNSTTFMEFNQFYLTRNNRKISMKLTNSDGKQPETSLDFVTGPRKTLWKNLPKVLNSGCLEKMTTKAIKRQEAMFEIFYSEGRYLHSLVVIENYFMKKLREMIPDVITEKNFNMLFSKIEPIIKSETAFMSEMCCLLQQDEMLHGLCAIIQKHYRNCWDDYLKYATHLLMINQLYDQELTHEKKIMALSDSIEAEKLPLNSFLSLPLQRITRLPLLLKSVITQADETSPEYMSYLETLAMVENLAKKCNDEVGRMKDCEEMLQITQQLQFPNMLHSFPLAQSSRTLCIRSQVKRICKAFIINHKERIEIFLFNDLFLYAKKQKGCCKLFVCEYSPRSELKIVLNGHRSPVELELLLLVDSNGHRSTLTVVFDCLTERQRWVTALTPLAPSAPIKAEDKQVIVIKKYAKKRPDELNLEIGDVIRIMDKNGEWYSGIRLIDGDIGWFPISYCHLIVSERIRRLNALLCLEIQSNSTDTPSS